MPLTAIESSQSIKQFVEEETPPVRTIVNKLEFHKSQKDKQRIDKKIKIKKKFLLTNNRHFINTYDNYTINNNDYQKSSNYSSSSKYTSFQKGNKETNLLDSSRVNPKNSKMNSRNNLYNNSNNIKLTNNYQNRNNTEINTSDIFRESESMYYNHLKQKYLERDADPIKIKEQMILALERKTNQLQALRIHRDELKFISNNNPYSSHIKIGYGVLKQKAKIEDKTTTLMFQLQNDIVEIDNQLQVMQEYYDFVMNTLNPQNDEDLIIDTLEEEQIMIENLQSETNHLFRELKQSDKKNAREVKQRQMEIEALRGSIKQKQDRIRDLKSKICAMHIKLHLPNNISKQKSMSLSIRKFNTKNHNSMKQAFIGNKNFKAFSKEVLEKVNEEEQIIKIVFYHQAEKEGLMFKCVYKGLEGIWHRNIQKKHNDENDKINIINNANSPIQQAPMNLDPSKIIQIYIKKLLSMKFYFKSKIVGIQCRIKTEKGNQHIQIGNCKNNIQHQLLTLINKKIITLSSFWHQKQCVGVGIWYLNKSQAGRNKSGSLQGRMNQISNKNHTPTKDFKQKPAAKQQVYNQYYSNNCLINPH